MKTLNIKTLIAAHNILGESPVWDERNKCLYWVDILAGFVNQYDSRRHTLKEWKVPSSMVAHAALCDDPRYLFLTLKDRFAVLDLKTGVIDADSESRLDGEAIRFNDGGVDPEGRLWIGTMDLEEKEPIGSLYCLADGELIKKDEGFIVANGLGWSPDGAIMYFTDSKARAIYRYDFGMGGISNRSLFIKIPEEHGFPDGLTVDQEGFIWGSHWNGARISRYSPEGEIDQVVELPVSRPTSCCFGGNRFSTLFIASASYGLSEEEKESQPEAGNLFTVETSTRGSSEFLFSLNHYYSKS